MILFKPCPPCCPASEGSSFPEIYVPQNFWNLAVSEKKAILKAIAYNNSKFSNLLLDYIATLESGIDLQQGN